MPDCIATGAKQDGDVARCREDEEEESYLRKSAKRSSQETSGASVAAKPVQQ